MQVSPTGQTKKSKIRFNIIRCWLNNNLTRWGKRCWIKAFPAALILCGSIMVMHPTVNRKSAGSNPARTAVSFVFMSNHGLVVCFYLMDLVYDYQHTGSSIMGSRYDENVPVVKQKSHEITNLESRVQILPGTQKR